MEYEIYQTKNGFQSTLPSRGATVLLRPGLSNRHAYFNPRSPRGERRSTLMAGWAHSSNFNPRSPRGERRSQQAHHPHCTHFNPRSPRGERLLAVLFEAAFLIISIHAPLAGSDLEDIMHHLSIDLISIHAPLAGSDSLHYSQRGPHLPISIHAPLAGSDRLGATCIGNGGISIHAPLAGSDSRYC